MTRFRIAATMLALVFSAAAVAAPLNAAWDAHVTNYIESWFAANPSSAVYAGRHEFDGRLPDFSAGALSAEAARLEVARKATAAFDPSGLDAARRIEREYLLSVIDESLFWRVEAKWPERNPSWYLGAIDPEIYLSKAYAPLRGKRRMSPPAISAASSGQPGCRRSPLSRRPPSRRPALKTRVAAGTGWLRTGS